MTCPAIKPILLFLVMLLSARIGLAQSAGQLVEGTEYRGVIFSADMKLQQQDTVRRWTPTAADIQLLEQDLKRFMAKQPKKSRVNQTSYGRAIHPQLGQYTRQYAGYLSPKGERMIYVNCFWNVDNDVFLTDWPTRLIQAFDGGNAYWRIHYKTVRRKFVGLSINGVG